MSEKREDLTCPYHVGFERRIKEVEGETKDLRKEVEVLKRDSSVNEEQISRIFDSLDEIKNSLKDINTTFNTAIRRPLETREKIKVGVIVGLITTIFSFWIANL